MRTIFSRIGFSSCVLCFCNLATASTPLPQDSFAHIETLENGIKTLLRQEGTEGDKISIRIVYERENSPNSKQSGVLQVDIPQAEEETVGRFFQIAKEKISDPEKLFIIAVGPFVEENMRTLIDHSFSSLVLHSTSENNKKKGREAVAFFSNLRDERENRLSLSYSLPIGALNTVEDLRERWVAALFQSLVIQTFKGKMQNRADHFSYPEASALTPAASFDLSFTTKQQHPLQLLSHVLTLCKEVREQGFTESQVTFAKERAKDFLSRLTTLDEREKNSILASYYEKQLQQGESFADFYYFLEKSPELIDSISAEELLQYGHAFLAEPNRSIALAYSSTDFNIGKEQIDQVMHTMKGEEPTISSSLLALADAQDQTAHAPADAYAQLPINEEEKKLIYKLLHTMAKDNVFQLLMEKKKLEKIGKKINSVHPLRFLGTVFTNQHLKECMHEIKKSGFKWDNFIDGISDRMKEESGRNNLVPYLKGFCTTLQVSYDDVMSYIKGGDFEGLVKYLMK